MNNYHKINNIPLYFTEAISPNHDGTVVVKAELGIPKSIRIIKRYTQWTFIIVNKFIAAAKILATMATFL